MQRLGQHFLKNEKVLQQIAKAATIKEAPTIIEIGPGHGELTDFLLEGINSRGRLILIEKDARFSKLLKEKFKDQKNVEVQEGDALRLLPVVVESLAAQAGDYLLVGNIPYYITGKLLHIIGELKQKPKRSILMIQEEVADRACASAPEMNRLAASVQFWADVEVVMRVPKEDFLPPPKVDSAVISLDAKTSKPIIEPARYYKAVHAIFSQPRKTLLNNLTDTPIRKRDCEIILKKLGIDPKSRPQNLSIPDIAIIAENFF